MFVHLPKLTNSNTQKKKYSDKFKKSIQLINLQKLRS